MKVLVIEIEGNTHCSMSKHTGGGHLEHSQIQCKVKFEANFHTKMVIILAKYKAN